MNSLRYITRKSVSFYSVLAFALGLSLNDNIFAVFSFGSTYFYFSQILSFVIFFLLLVNKGKTVQNSICMIPHSFSFLLVLIMFSTIIGAFFTSLLDLYIYRSFASYILLVFNIVTLIDVIALKKQHRYLIYGIVTGLLLNLFFSTFAYFTFSFGNMFSLKQFSIRKYDFIDFYYVFRAQGMFLEPSHFVRYIILISFILIGFRLSKKGSLSLTTLIITAFTIFVLLLTRSGSIVIFSVVFLLFLIMSLFSSKVSKKIKKTMAVALLFSSICLFFIFAFSKFDLPGYLSSAISGANIADEENAERFNSIKYGLSMLLENPLGAGWGIAGTLYESSQFVAPFSFFLSMALEIGLLGTFVYVFSILQIIVALIKRKDIYSLSLCASLLCLLALQLGTDYAFDSLIMTVIGFSICSVKNSNYPTNKMIRIRALD